ncbi:MAG: hypothetical protein MJZ63_02215 [Muribaculaceae bacterium]|nr:hypothetical protein [Muribaculaceae bacterium]
MNILWQSADSNRGGSISFSLEVNASKSLSTNPFFRHVHSRWLTLQNRVWLRRRLHRLCIKYGVGGWSISKRGGHYVSPEGKGYDEPSLLLEIIEIDSGKLFAFAESLCAQFRQRSVLIHDYNTAKFTRITPS